MAYDVFISYRRKGAGAGVAGELQAKLENHGYKVFLDVDDIASGDFPAQIEEAIRGCKDFLLILSPGMLDRCADEEDWVRHEITLAEECGKNIIGVSLPGFVMPDEDSLPEPLKKLPEKQVFLWSHEYRNASLTKIDENLVSRRKKKKRRLVSTTLSLCLLAVAAVAGVLWWMSRPQEEEPVVVNEDPAVEMAKEMEKQFAAFIARGDSLTGAYPVPELTDQFATFMEGIDSYESALSLSKQHPEVSLDTRGLSHKIDSLSKLREERFAEEVAAVPVFLNVKDMKTARERYENAWVLAVTEAERNSLVVYEQKFEK